jgi:hypothetical protein
LSALVCARFLPALLAAIGFLLMLELLSPNLVLCPSAAPR